MNFRKNKKKLIIAEVGQSHNGSFNEAKKLIDLTARAGADVIKFQTHFADAESTLDEKFRKGYNFKQKNRLEYWKKHLIVYLYNPTLTTQDIICQVPLYVILLHVFATPQIILEILYGILVHVACPLCLRHQRRP